MEFAFGCQISVVIHEHWALELAREHRAQGHPVPVLQRGKSEYRALIYIHNRRNTHGYPKQPASWQPSLSEQLPQFFCDLPADLARTAP